MKKRILKTIILSFLLSTVSPVIFAVNKQIEPSTMNIRTHYDSLIKKLKGSFYLKTITELMDWDEKVMMPAGGADLRANQVAELSKLIHEQMCHPQIGEDLNYLEAHKKELSFDQEVVVREVHRDYDRAVKIPSEFVARKKIVEGKGYQAWVEAREKKDYALYAPALKELIELSKEEAGYVGYQNNPYDYFIDSYNQGLTANNIAEDFAAFKKELLPIVHSIIHSKTKNPNTDIFKNFPEDKQKELLTDVITAIGFDFHHGRLDSTIHPFCSGPGEDSRLTTAYKVNDPLFSLYSGLHEAGHGLYEQGQIQANAGTPLGETLKMAMHESQSRLWENQVGRSQQFFNYWEPKLRTLFPAQLANVDSETLYRAINAVAINPIRIQSDEVTYNLHIMLRFELEQRLFDGSLSVEDLPKAWNTLSKEFFDYVPKNDVEGVMQDVHWAVGAFGYFPSYTLGNMIAAQFWHKMKQDMPDLNEQMAAGNYKPILAWLRENVHQHGKRYSTDELVKRVTGEGINFQYLIDYLKERYLPLYQ